MVFTHFIGPIDENARSVSYGEECSEGKETCADETARIFRRNEIEKSSGN